VGQTIVVCGLPAWARGPRTVMKTRSAFRTIDDRFLSSVALAIASDARFFNGARLRSSRFRSEALQSKR